MSIAGLLVCIENVETITMLVLESRENQNFQNSQQEDYHSENQLKSNRSKVEVEKGCRSLGRCQTNS